MCSSDLKKKNKYNNYKAGGFIFQDETMVLFEKNAILTDQEIRGIREKRQGEATFGKQEVYVKCKKY